MRTLDEFNADRRAAHEAARRRLDSPQPNGIACPECDSELVDSDPRVVLASNPPQKHVHCVAPECDYRGHRVA